MRTAAGEGARRLTSLNAGDPVKVTGKTDDWYRIVLPFGATGFVLERLLGPVSPLGDEIAPTIQIAEVLETATDSIQLAGLVTDASRITEFIIQNEAVGVGENGAFQTTLYVPLGGLTVLVTAVDEFGNRAERTIQVARVQEAANAAFQFDPLNPTAQASRQTPMPWRSSLASRAMKICPTRHLPIATPKSSSILPNGLWGCVLRIFVCW